MNTDITCAKIIGTDSYIISTPEGQALVDTVYWGSKIHPVQIKAEIQPLKYLGQGFTTWPREKALLYFEGLDGKTLELSIMEYATGPFIILWKCNDIKD